MMKTFSKFCWISCCIQFKHVVLLEPAPGAAVEHDDYFLIYRFLPRMDL